MEPSLKLWRQQPGSRAVDEVSTQRWRCAVDARQKEFVEIGRAPLRVLDLHPDPLDQLVSVFAALDGMTATHLFLGSPQWSPAESAEARVIAQPDFVPGDAAPLTAGRSGNPDRTETRENLIMIPTGGTTGGIRFVVHTIDTLENAAHGLVRWLLGTALDCVCFLPVFHVSGLMQAMRCRVSGGRLVLADWTTIAAGAFPRIDSDNAVTSLVPTQLARLLEIPGAGDWLRSFRCVFVGGAAAWPAVLDRARRDRIPLAPCYGMSETAAQITAMHPDDFRQGIAGVGHALPHAKVSVVDAASGKAVDAGQTGVIAISASSLFRGYYPDFKVMEAFVSSDLGRLDADGTLTVMGRTDRWINTGGEKVDPAEVEAALMSLADVRDAAVFGQPDDEWGEVVTACVVGIAKHDSARLRASLREKLAAHKVPKRIAVVDAIPRTSAGKIDRRALTGLLKHRK